jgi:sterol desaturase/sphingolipid hydroxylase (fatty acid hydroxylase superfamily)
MEEVLITPVVSFVGAIAGIVLVDFCGYVWHRFVEHDGWCGDRVRYGHWLHHEYFYPPSSLRPDRRYRDAGSWTWYVMGVLLAIVLALALPAALSLPIIIAGALYGALIEFLHRSCHIKGRWENSVVWRWLRDKHDIHHCRNYNFGVVCFLWDRLCGTWTRAMPRSCGERFPGYKGPRGLK